MKLKTRGAWLNRFTHSCQLRQSLSIPTLNNKIEYSEVRSNSTNPDAGYPDHQLSGTAWPFA